MFNEVEGLLQRVTTGDPKSKRIRLALVLAFAMIAG